MAVPLLPRTLVLSVGMHLAVAVAAFRSPTTPSPQEAMPASDVWSGQAVEVDSVSLPGEDTATAEAAPAPPIPEVPAPAPDPPAASRASEAEPEAEAEPRLEPVRPPRPERKPRPREERPGEPEPRPVASSPTSSGEAERLAAAPTSAPPEPGARGAFGMTGLPQGVRHLPKAFTRALPQASSGDESWSALPLGAAGAVEISIPVDSDGKLGQLSYPKPKLAAEQVAAVRNAVERTMMLLRAGTFSLDPNKVENGVQRLRVEFEVSEVPDDGRDGVDHYEKGFVAPEGGRPGRSIFVSSSGRRVEARVYVVP